jgi:carbon-monoxide dehydrogenase medium subunit
VAVTGAKACVFRASALESKLQASWDTASCNGTYLSPSDMTTDLHGSGEYRAALIPVLAGRAVAGS